MIKFVLIFIILKGGETESIRTHDFNSHRDCVHAGQIMEAMIPKGKRHRTISWHCVPNNE